jgi:hypothetical protein
MQGAEDRVTCRMLCSAHFDQLVTVASLSGDSAPGETGNDS